MYPNEIADFLKNRNYQLKGRDIEQVIDVSKNPQLTRVEFDNSNGVYEMWDSYGNYYKFKVKTIDDMER